MKNLERYNYCVVFLGDLEGVREDIESISISDGIGWAQSKNVCIATFISFFTPEEIKEMFTDDDGEWENRNFFIMKTEESSVFFSNEIIYKKLFSVFSEDGKFGSEMVDISMQPRNNNSLPLDMKNRVEGLNDEEKEEMINDILDKGSKIDEQDKMLLKLLSKN